MTEPVPSDRLASDPDSPERALPPLRPVELPSVNRAPIEDDSNDAYLASTPGLELPVDRGQPRAASRAERSAGTVDATTSDQELADEPADAQRASAESDRVTPKAAGPEPRAAESAAGSEPRRRAAATPAASSPGDAEGPAPDEAAAAASVEATATEPEDVALSTGRGFATTGLVLGGVAVAMAALDGAGIAMGLPLGASAWVGVAAGLVASGLVIPAAREGAPRRGLLGAALGAASVVAILVLEQFVR